MNAEASRRTTMPTPVANARMYAVNATVKALWHRLFARVLDRAGLDWPLVDHDAPAPLSALWARDDLGLAMMCGLPFAEFREGGRSAVQLVAAPVPSPARYGGRPVYCTDIVVRHDAPARTLADTFGGVAGYTLGSSLSGGVAFAAHVAAHAAAGLDAYRARTGGLIHARGVIGALASGRIDVGPLDSYYHDLLRRHEPELAAQVRVVDHTAWRPIPPLVATAPLAGETLERLQAALLSCASDPALGDTLDRLLLAGFARPAASDYADLPALRRAHSTAFDLEP